VVVVGAAVVVVVVVVVVEVVGINPFIVNVKEFVQVPVEVTVICVAVLSTLTILPFNNSVFVAVDGDTLPTLAVKLKFGPKLIPNPLFNNTFTFIFYSLTEITSTTSNLSG
jgi:hypothetical protein